MASLNSTLGRKLGDDLNQIIREFYLSDSASRVMPGKNFKSIYSEEEGEGYTIRNVSCCVTLRKLTNYSNHKIPRFESDFQNLRNVGQNNVF